MVTVCAGGREGLGREGAGGGGGGDGLGGVYRNFNLLSFFLLIHMLIIWGSLKNGNSCIGKV